MSLKYIKETYPEVYKKSNQSSLSWIMKNKKNLITSFTKKFPKSPFKFVAQFPTNRGSLLITNEGEVKSVNNVSFLNLNFLKRMGMPTR